MEKRVLLAVSLSFAVLVLYQLLFVKSEPPRAVPPASQGTSATASQTAGTTPSALSSAPPPVTLPAVAGVTGDDAEREIVVESADVRAVFTNRGAVLKHWQLKRYVDERGRPIDIIPDGIPETEVRAFALVAEDPAVTERLRTALYKASATELNVDSGQRELTFEYEDASGLRARKTLEFAASGQPYLVNLTAVVEQRGTTIPVAVSSGPGIGDVARALSGGSFLSPSYYQGSEALIQRGRDVTRIASTQIPDQAVHEGTFTGIGSDDQYFLSLLLAGDRNVRVTYEQLHLTTSFGPRDLVRYRARVAGGLNNVRMYLGPKQYEMLAATNRELVRTINFGMFDWLVVPLLQALKWIDRYVGNFGWSIITLTLLINAAIAPLRHRSVVSMRKMQEIQPQVKVIQDRYAGLKSTDPAKQKMNTELMNLYRERGVNPASGCLPMLLTMPVLFAFYSMLSQAIELRGAPFAMWIRDLSQHDPYYVTPLLMGGSMVWQQKLTPSTADPVQQKMMMFMPVMFTFMFLWAPSGLVLYWLVSNLWAIGQQYVTNRLIGPPQLAPAPRPPAERRMKQAGAGRTEQAR
jgi:YidC/Oxa1 family membrane protein insertase